MPDIKTSSADPRSLLIELLGKAFVNWLLPTYGNAEVQLEIANALLAHAAKATELNQAAGGRYLIVGLLGYVPDWGDTGINALRLQAGGEPVPAPTSTGDATVDALGELAAERIGEMLLPVGRFGPDLVTSYRTPALDRAIAAIRSDTQLPFSSTDDEMESVTVRRSTGAAGEMQLISMPTTLLNTAAKLIAARGHALTVDVLADVIAELVPKIRTGMHGPVDAVGLVGLTGLRLPVGYQRDFKWGQLREIRPTDLPPGLTHLAERRTIMAATDGTPEVMISDAGESLIEMTLPYRIWITNGRLDELSDAPLDVSTALRLRERVLQVRLAHVLAWDRGQPPVLIESWQRVIELLEAGSSYAFNDPQRFPSRTPTQLTQEQAAAWTEWIERLDEVEFKKLGVAPERVLRAASERHDPTDALIDAVIAWEALLGGDTEMTLRVSTAIARLLEPPGEQRSKLRRRAADLYRLRSRVVHGDPLDRASLYDSAAEAVDIALRLLIVLIQERGDLLPMTSTERSIRILLE